MFITLIINYKYKKTFFNLFYYKIEHSYRKYQQIHT